MRDVACRAHRSAARQPFRVGKSKGVLVGPANILPRFNEVSLFPVLRGPVTAFTADAVFPAEIGRGILIIGMNMARQTQRRFVSRVVFTP